MSPSDPTPSGRNAASGHVAHRAWPRTSRRDAFRWSLAACASLALGPLARPARAADLPGGLIALPRGREIALVSPDGSADRTVVSLEPGQFIADVALSPDGGRLAFGLFTGGVGSTPGGSDIVVTSVDNDPADRRILVARDRPGLLLAGPRWSPDGSALVFDSVGLAENGQPTATVEWVAADGSGRRTLADGARTPSFSPDGRTVVYTRVLPNGDAMWARPVAGGDAVEIISETRYLVVAYPRISPDGQSIAFAGAGDDPPAPKLIDVAHVPIAGAPDLWGADRHRRGILAHGYPADPFVVRRDGTQARRVANLLLDDLAIAWSPDGAWLAASGATGLMLVNAADGTSRLVTADGSFGAIDWR